MSNVGLYVFDTEQDARAYLNTLPNPEKYEVRDDGLCWGVFEREHVHTAAERQEEEFATFLNSLAF